MQVIFTEGPALVLNHARDFLVSEPVLHNLILTLLHARIAHPEPGRYWVAEDGGKSCGVVFQSPLHFAATITPMHPDAIPPIVDAVANVVKLPGINGEAATAARFAGHWSERCKSAAFPVQGMRLYELQQVQQRPSAPGRLRKAQPDDRRLALDCVRAFAAEVGEQPDDPALQVDRWLCAECI